MNAADFLREYFRGTEGRVFIGAVRNAKSALAKGEIDKLITRNSRAIDDFVARYDKPEHECAIYYCTATLRNGRAARAAADCSQFSSLFGDCDDHNHNLDRARVIDLLEALECPPTMIVDSGHGLQPHWLLAEATEDAERIIAARKKLQAILASDKVHDAPRYMRLPGTHNSKNGDWLAVEVVSHHPERRYSLEVLEDWLDTADVVIPRKAAPKPKANGAAFVPPPSTGPGTDHRRGAAWARTALEASAAELASAPEGSRHAMLRDKTVRMGTMIARGWIDIEEVRRVLFAAASACGEINDYGVEHFNKTFADGIKYGTARPHPDLPNDEPAGPGPAAPDQISAEPDATAKRGAPEPRSNGNKALSAKELNNMRFEPIKYVVPGIIVEGLTLLAGKPKIGKSWLLLHAAVAVARGGFTLGEIHCAAGDVLYCALEDNLRRLQSRMTKLLGTEEWPARLFFRCEMPRLAEGGLQVIKDWIKTAEHPRLVIIDTLAMVRAPKKREESSYDSDYGAVKELRALANEHGIAIVLVHHLRKQDADDAFDTVSGTLGLTGAPDTILVLKRDSSGNTVLHGRGRDLIEIEKAIIFNADACTWTIAGELRDVRSSNERRNILAAMREIELPASPSDIAGAANMKNTNVKKLLPKMIEDGTVKKCDYGKYELIESPEQP